MSAAPTTEPIQRLAIIGAGAWGTALAITAARAGAEVSLWARGPQLADEIQRRRLNEPYLPGHEIPASIAVTADMRRAARNADAIILAVPSQAVRSIAAQLHPLAADGVPVVLASKGVERDSGMLLTAVIEDVMPDREVAVLSGPSFATEVAAGHPTAVTIASTDASERPDSSLAARLSVALATDKFRPYVSDDVVGVEVSGAVKNVIAIACGIARGRGFGANTWAALITRGLEEIRRLTEALGGRAETVTGLAGMGDLALTCSSEQSRNFSFGIALGTGRPQKELLENRRSVVEGVENARAVTDLARSLGVEMPISEAVRSVVSGDTAIDDAIGRLMDRPLKADTVRGPVRIQRPEREPEDTN